VLRQAPASSGKKALPIYDFEGACNGKICGGGGPARKRLFFAEGFLRSFAGTCLYSDEGRSPCFFQNAYYNFIFVPPMLFCAGRFCVLRLRRSAMPEEPVGARREKQTVTAGFF
ncbi:MAG: hypothetical protein Q4C02_04510, partial [Eubacteriales bacterium]|nr:hypothetical protein [Eubacteriales bacterium]